MEWNKLKNIIILILLVVNGFLLVLVGARREEAVHYERTALEQTVRALERGGIQVDADAVSAADGLTPISVERDLDGEARLARALLDEEVEGSNRGGGLYLYRGRLGEVSLRPGGELSVEFKEDARWKTDRPEQHAATLLKRLGVEGTRTSATEEGGRTAVRFRQRWNGTAVFTCEVEFVYLEGMLKTLRGTLLLAAGGRSEAGQVLTLPTALMRFSEEVGAAGDVCSAILSMEAGYRGTAQSLSGGARLAPVWLVSTDTASYYLDCVTGALTRLTDQ